MARKFNQLARFLVQTLPMHVVFLVTALLPNSGVTVRIRGFLLRPFFKSCGKHLKVASGVVINNPHQIELGDNVYLAHNVWVNGIGGLKIEDNVLIGPMSVIVTSQHTFEDGQLTKMYQSAPVHIQSNCWLASHVVVTEGITIESHSIIGAGAVVTKSIPPNSKVGGVPAEQLEVYKHV